MTKTDKQENNGAGSVFCRRCKEFLHEDESGYGFCRRNYQPHRYSDLCEFETIKSKRK